MKARKIDIDPTTAAAAEIVYGKLTRPDSEDWTVIPAGDTVHICAYQETRQGDKCFVHVRRGTSPLVEFKRLVARLPVKSKMGCVTVILCRDAEQMGGIDLMSWLKRQAKAKNFSLTSFIGPATTAEAIASMQSISPDIPGAEASQ
jgi:hypothetical protein